ncbi:MAG: flippase-like domain-containing protein [bacterium]|nr:flippase-like domain-containing protein [bacterium]
MRRKLLPVLIALACVAGLAWALSRVGWGRVLETAARADPLWLALSIVPVLGRFVIWALKWQRMLARRAPVPFSLTFRILIAGSFANLTTPTAKVAGGIVRALLLKARRGWALGEAYGWALVDQITNVMGPILLYGVLATATGLLLPDHPDGAAFLVTGPGALGLVGLLIALRGWGWGLVRRPHVVRLLTDRLPSRIRSGDTPPEEGVRAVLGPLLHEAGPARVFLSDVALAAVAFGSICVANAMVLRSLGSDAPLLLIATAAVLGYFGGIAVGVWGGIGVTEAALTGLYVHIGIPIELAAAGALLHRATFYALVLGIGGYSLVREGRPDA